MAKNNGDRPNKKLLNFSLDPDVIEALRRAAADGRLSLSATANQKLAQALDVPGIPLPAPVDDGDNGLRV